MVFFSEALLSCQNIRGFFWRIFRTPADYHNTQESKLGLGFAVLQQLQQICARAQVYSAIMECPYRVKQGAREFCSAASTAQDLRQPLSNIRFPKAQIASHTHWGHGDSRAPKRATAEQLRDWRNSVPSASIQAKDDGLLVAEAKSVPGVFCF